MQYSAIIGDKQLISVDEARSHILGNRDGPTSVEDDAVDHDTIVRPPIVRVWRIKLMTCTSANSSQVETLQSPTRLRFKCGISLI